MRGPIAGEASVASTVGIIGGTAGTLGTVAGALMPPLVIFRLQSWLPASAPKRVDATHVGVAGRVHPRRAGTGTGFI